MVVTFTMSPLEACFVLGTRWAHNGNSTLSLDKLIEKKSKQGPVDLSHGLDCIYVLLVEGDAASEQESGGMTVCLAFLIWINLFGSV